MIVDDDIPAVIGRVVAQLVPMPVVTPAQYRQISCNRCGLCCEDIRSVDSPEATAVQLVDPTVDDDRRRFLSGLEAVGRVGALWRYRCRHFTRDADGLGCCTIHATRPAICRDYPYGKVVWNWPQCAWFVQVRDEQGAVVSEVAPLSSGAEAGG